MEVDLQAKTKYMLMSHNQKAEQTATTYSANVANYKYLEIKVTNQNLIHWEIMSIFI
jgi:hypothetical protein